MRVRWLTLALQDLDEIAQFIHKDNPAVAEGVVEKIWDSVYSLESHPHSGRPGRVKETRELLIVNLPFIVPYRVKNNHIEILRVLHTSRKWPESFSF